MSSAPELVSNVGNTTSLLSAHNKLTRVSTMFTHRTEDHL